MYSPQPPLAYRVLEETSDFLLIDKMPGISMHDSADEAGLITRLRQERHDDALYPVHRLDKVTSGLLLIGRTRAATAALSEQFRLGRVEKYYLAISDRKPRKKQGSIIGDMVIARRGCWRLTRSSNNPAVTQFFSFPLDVSGQRLFVLKPRTGKTHQLRVALKSLGAPIVGDARYAGTTAERVYLHAWRLSFTCAGRNYCFSAVPTSWLSRMPGLERQLVSIGDPCLFPWPVLPVREKSSEHR